MDPQYQTVQEVAQQGPKCAMCGYPAPDRRMWANLGLIGIWKFGRPQVPLCLVCHKFFSGLVQIKDVVVDHLRGNGIHIGVPPSQAQQSTSTPSIDPPPGMEGANYD